MKSSALILIVALGMASSAQARQCAHSDVHPKDKCKNGARFHICAATIPNPAQLFNPATTLDSDYDTPDCDPTKTVTQADIDLFNKVYGLLTGGPGPGRTDVSNKFCRKLKNLFVATGANAYGVWEHPERGDGSMFIVVPPLANQPGQPQKLADQENLMLRAAFAAYGKTVPAGLEYDSVDQPDQGMALLSILAHELGHLLLADVNADGTGGDGKLHPRSDPSNGNCDKPAVANRCFESKFLQAGASNTLWNRHLFYNNMRRWIDFGSRNNNKYLDTAHDLDSIGTYGTFLDGAEFVSFYAAVSPEEDFVETYKYKILADVAKTSQLKLKLPGGGEVTGLLDKVTNATGNLKGKIDCVTPLTR